MIVERKTKEKQIKMRKDESLETVERERERERE